MSKRRAETAMGHSTREASSRRLADVSVPKIRKIVHKVCTKHHDDKFYQKIDLIKKVLRKLKIHPVGCSETSKVRNLINRWIATNKPADEDNDDKKEIKTKIAKINEAGNEPQSVNAVDGTTKELVQTNSSELVPIVVLRTDEVQIVDKNSKESVPSEVVPVVVSSTEIQTSTGEQKISASVDSLTESTEIKKEKIIPLIDLTILDADEIKKEPVENHENSNTALENQVENAVMPGYNYDYYYGYPYNPYNYNYNYNYNYYWYQAYYNGYINYDQYQANTNNWNGVYSSPPVSYANNTNQHT